MIEKAGMTNAKPDETSFTLKNSLNDKRAPLTEKKTDEIPGVPYHAVLGAVLYRSTRICPKIAPAVSLPGTFQSELGSKHRCTIKHVVRYLYGTTNFGTWLPSGSTAPTFEVRCDANRGRDQDRRRYHSSYLLSIARGPVTWSSKRQSNTTGASTEVGFTTLEKCIVKVKGGFLQY